MSESLDTEQVQIQAVYLIDDSDDEAFLAKRLIKRANLQLTIKAFPTLARFFEYAENTPDVLVARSLMIVDLYLDLELGTDVIPRVVATCPMLIVGMSTGSEDPRDRQKALESGAWFYVGKPLDGACIESICKQVNGLELHQSNEGLCMFYQAG